MSIDTRTTDTASAIDKHPTPPKMQSRPKKRSLKRSKSSQAKPEWYTDFEPGRRGLELFWWLLWWLYGALRLYNRSWVYVPHHWGSLNARIAANDNHIWQLASLVSGVYEEESSTGGVGKTTGTTWHAAEMQRAADTKTLVIDADSGARGKDALRYEIDLESQKLKFETLHQLVLLGKWKPTHHELDTWLPRHEETGVRLLATDDSISLTETRTKKVIQELLPAFSTIFIDTTPGIKEDINRGTRSVSTVISIPCLFANSELEHDIKCTRTYMNAQENGSFERRLEEGRLFISVSDVPKRDFNRRTQYALAEMLDVPPSQVLLFPSDKHLYAKGSVRRAKISKHARYAFSESTRSRADAAASYNRRFPLPFPQPEGKKDDVQRVKKLRADLISACGSKKDAAAAILGGDDV